MQSPRCAHWKLNSLCRVKMTKVGLVPVWQQVGLVKTMEILAPWQCRCVTFNTQLCENRAEKIKLDCDNTGCSSNWHFSHWFDINVWPADRQPPSLMNACPGLSFHGNLRCRGAEATCALSSPNTHLQMQKTLRIGSGFQNKRFEWRWSNNSFGKTNSV